jgi:energy-coupling factor transport system permease protein
MMGSLGGRAGLLFYRPLASPLHAARAGVAAVWALALAAAALLLYHPLALLALTLALLGAGWGAGVGRELARALRLGLILAVPTIAVNLLVSREGLTVFARLGDLGPFGQGDLTVEALVYGAVIALKVTLVILATTLASLAVDPDALLRILRRLSFRSALTASLAVRLIPLLAVDAGRLAEAQRTRPDGGPRGARGRVALLGAVLAGSLDRALDVAATLELRGFAHTPRAGRNGDARQKRVSPGFGRNGDACWMRASPGFSRDGDARWTRASPGFGRLRRPWSRHDLAFAASAAAVLVLAVLARLGGMAAFAAYPRVHAPVGSWLLVLCGALLLATLLPFLDRRGIEPQRL